MDALCWIDSPRGVQWPIQSPSARELLAGWMVGVMVVVNLKHSPSLPLRLLCITRGVWLRDADGSCFGRAPSSKTSNSELKDESMIGRESGGREGNPRLANTKFVCAGFGPGGRGRRLCKRKICIVGYMGAQNGRSFQTWVRFSHHKSAPSHSDWPTRMKKLHWTDLEICSPARLQFSFKLGFIIHTHTYTHINK